MLRVALLGSCFALFALAGCSSQQTSPTISPVTPAPHTLVPTIASTGTPVMGCSVISAQPTQAAAQGLPAVTSSDYVRGPENAAVTMLGYCDFQSAQCEIFNRVVDQLAKEHPDDLRVVLRPYPVPISAVKSLDKSQISVQAAVAAGNQGKFWEMRDLLDSQYDAWTKLSAAVFEKWVTDQAGRLGLDASRFSNDLASAETLNRVKQMSSDASSLGIGAWPTVFINGTLQSRAAYTYDGLESTIALLSLAPKEFKTCPPFSIDPARQYVATLHTEKGDIVMQLYADKAPLAANSFIYLARQGWYNGVTFQRVLPGFIAQTGDPSGTGQGGPGYYFKSEIRADLRFDRPGVVGMANSGPDTNGSQFFITYAPEAKLDGSFTIFAQIIKGMDVVESLTPRDPQLTAGLPPGDKIESITIQEK